MYLSVKTDMQGHVAPAMHGWLFIAAIPPDTGRPVALCGFELDSSGYRNGGAWNRYRCLGSSMGCAMDHETDMQANDDRAYGTVAEVAAAYGVSPDTIRRRMKRGDLQGRREQIPSGYRWLLPMPAPGETLPGHESAITPAPDHAAMVEVLQGELAARNDEIQRLHTLLDVQARALEAVAARPALPAPQKQAADDPQADTPGSPAPDHPAGIWSRLKRWYRLEG